MDNPLEDAALQATQDLDWKRVRDQLIPRYTQATLLACNSAISAATQASSDVGKPISPELWNSIIHTAFTLTYYDALKELSS